VNEVTVGDNDKAEALIAGLAESGRYALTSDAAKVIKSQVTTRQRVFDALGGKGAGSSYVDKPLVGLSGPVQKALVEVVFGHLEDTKGMIGAFLIIGDGRAADLLGDGNLAPLARAVDRFDHLREALVIPAGGLALGTLLRGLEYKVGNSGARGVLWAVITTIALEIVSRARVGRTCKDSADFNFEAFMDKDGGGVATALAEAKAGRLHWRVRDIYEDLQERGKKSGLSPGAEEGGPTKRGCFDFKSSKGCSRGDGCRYSHEADAKCPNGAGCVGLAEGRCHFGATEH